MNKTKGQKAFVVRQDGAVVVILAGTDAAEAASWWVEDGFEVVQIDLAPTLVAA